MSQKDKFIVVIRHSHLCFGEKGKEVRWVMLHEKTWGDSLRYSPPLSKKICFISQLKYFGPKLKCVLMHICRITRFYDFDPTPSTILHIISILIILVKTEVGKWRFDVGLLWVRVSSRCRSFHEVWVQRSVYHGHWQYQW